ncbi:Protein phosphatase 1 regulatory subunit 15A [Nesidiocoris tenuis]|uniref:Protein phosphatase 1 regulatory subunit 15A n=2 Tax=Nesidiocoris tenuis TaxID=355587 RepID=A0ABN7A534_9HEMI|nr:Protein phosphatase 1 regulatory subunit 15A [Nesidiocoris tenuis]
MNNLHNMTKKNLFDGYVGPPPVISRCYTTKANSTPFPGSPLLTMNKYLSNVGHYGKRGEEIRTHRNDNVRAVAPKMPPLVCKSTTACTPFVQIVGGFVGSKSQAGCTNLRGREFSLWDAIVDKLYEFMEQSEMPKLESKRTDRVEGSRNLGKVGDFIFSPFGYETSENTNWRSECYNFQPEKARENHDNSPLKTMPFSCYDSPISIGNPIAPNNCTDFIARSPETLVPCSPSPERAPPISRTLILPDEERIADDSGRGTPSNVETQLSSECLIVDSSPVCLNGQSIPEETSCSSPTETPRLIAPTGENSAVPAPSLQTPTNSNLSFSGSRLSFTDSEDGDAINASPALSSSCDSGSIDLFFPKRILAQRSVSECSVESDDSFIVFDYVQDDPEPVPGGTKSRDSSAPYFELSIQVSEDSGDEADSDVDLDEVDHYILFSRNTDAFPPEPYLSRCDEANIKWNSFYGKNTAKDIDANRLPKKVKFAQDKELIKIRRLVAWDFAHRAARVGPWEMYYRDSVRFKNRIANYSTLLSPILEASHRARIYSERFDDPT